MSRLPRGPATAGTIRPPASGLTLPRGLGSKDFLNDVPEMPPLTQRVQPGSRRATLTAATFSPPIEGSATIARSSGFAATPGSGFGRAASPSPSSSRDLHSTVALRTPPLPTAAASSKDMSATLARARARSPAHSFGTLQFTPGHDVPKGLALSRGGHPLPRNGDGVSLTQRLGSGAAQLPTIPSTLGNTGLVGTIGSTLMAAPRPSSAAGLRCGDPVFIPLQNLRGTLRFLGPIDGKQGTWAGVELDEVGKGKNDGSVAGKSYFVCPPNTGIFAAPSKVEPPISLRTQSHAQDRLGVLGTLLRYRADINEPRASRLDDRGLRAMPSHPQALVCPLLTLQLRQRKTGAKLCRVLPHSTKRLANLDRGHHLPFPEEQIELVRFPPPSQ
ncbi:hypothetical protein GGI17_000181 [Coemansia sp. S146]|nr:hypothetical protein GGI17_000181 [Coemansia sp. S146]